jgi:hypothetical protein
MAPTTFVVMAGIALAGLRSKAQFADYLLKKTSCLLSEPVVI